MKDSQIRIVRALQDGIPLSESPFDEIACRAGVSVDYLLQQINQWKEDGTIRRFGAVLRHRRAGFEFNAMVAWDVPDDRVDAFARAAASHRSVSHCYQRPRFPGFAYNVYTMIHGKSESDLENVVESIEQDTSVSGRAVLHTTAEYKKTSPVYFAGPNSSSR